MEVAKPAVPEGPKPLKCFTPPPDYKESETESETDEDVSGDESEEDESSSSETNGNVIKSSVKVEDEFLKNVRIYCVKQFISTFNSFTLVFIDD